MFLKVVFSVTSILAAIIWIDSSNGLRAIPVRTNITYYNTKYIEDPKFTITRFGRKSQYYFNIHANILTEWRNNVTIQLIFNEFLNNEYKPSFIQFKEKFCDFLSSNQYIGTAIRHAGMSCPVSAKHYSLENITFPTENFPNVFPFKKGRVDVFITRTADTTLMETAFVELHFEMDRMKKKSAF